jgi:hypothetical protein
MRYPLKASLFFVLIGLSACGIGGHQMNGVSGREKTEYLNSIKPYGVHWIKEGMTRESRIEDIVVCGAKMDLEIEFPNDSMEKTMALPEIKKLTGHRYATTEQVKWVAAKDLLRDSWRQCMVQRGYAQIPMGLCDARCLHP